MAWNQLFLSVWGGGAGEGPQTPPPLLTRDGTVLYPWPCECWDSRIKAKVPLYYNGRIWPHHTKRPLFQEIPRNMKYVLPNRFFIWNVYSPSTYFIGKSYSPYEIMRGYRGIFWVIGPPPPYGCLQFFFACWFAQGPATIWIRSWNSCSNPPPLLNVRTPPPFWILDPRLEICTPPQ